MGPPSVAPPPDVRIQSGGAFGPPPLLLIKPVRTFEEPLHRPPADSTRSATLIAVEVAVAVRLGVMVLALAKLRGVGLGR